MLKTQTMKIGSDKYKINYDAEMVGSEVIGQICKVTGEIRLRLYSPANVIMPNTQLMKTLVHEVVHGIDFQTFFIQNEEDTEIAVEMFANYIIDNLEKILLQELDLNDFNEFCELTQIDLKRMGLFLRLLDQVLEENPVFTDELMELFI